MTTPDAVWHCDKKQHTPMRNATSRTTDTPLRDFETANISNDFELAKELQILQTLPTTPSALRESKICGFFCQTLMLSKHHVETQEPKERAEGNETESTIETRSVIDEADWD